MKALHATLSTVLMLTLSACATAAPVTTPPTEEATRPPTNTPPAPTETAAPDPWRDRAAAYAAAPCTLILSDEVAALTGAAIEEEPIEEIGRDEPTDSVRSICTYQDVVVLTVVMPPQVPDLFTISDPSLGAATESIYPPIGQSAQWYAGSSAIAVTHNYLWYSIRILTEGNARDLALRMAEIVDFRLNGADPMAMGALPTPQGRPNISSCDAVTQEEAESILGPLTSVTVGGSTGELVGNISECLYERSPYDTVMLSYIYYSTPEAAQERHLAEQDTTYREGNFVVGPVDGIGDAAYFAEYPESGGVGTIYVVAGTLSLWIGPAHRDDVIAMAEIAVSRLVEVEFTPEAPAAAFSSCDAIGREQIESIIGALTEEPLPFDSVGEGVGYFGGCNYQSGAAFVVLSFGPLGGGQPCRLLGADRIGSRTGAS